MTTQPSISPQRRGSGSSASHGPALMAADRTLGERQKSAGRGNAVQRAAHTVGMPVRLHHIVVDAWSFDVLLRELNHLYSAFSAGEPSPLPDLKTVKNRVHLDLTSSAADRDQEIDRLLALGARRADIGQTGAESWTVLADPEGNEFCVVRPKETLIR